MSDHSIYLRVSGVYVHENCCLGAQGHPPTYVTRRRFQRGPLKQIWYLVHVTGSGQDLKRAPHYGGSRTPRSLNKLICKAKPLTKRRFKPQVSAAFGSVSIRIDAY